MYRLLLSFVLLLPAILCNAQKDNFGIVNYTVPSGYELAKHDNVLTYYKEDKSAGTYCNFFIYNTMPGHGSTQSDFDFAWANLVQKPFKVTGTASLQPEAVLKGWKFLLGNTKYSDNGVATLALLINFSGENNMQSICILSNSDKYKTDIESFIASVDLSKEASTNRSSVAKVNAVNENTQLKPGADKGLKPEVWMKSRFEYDVMKRVSLTKYEWIAVYPDGKFYPYMPTEGFAGFYEKNKDWGKAVWSGNRLNVTDPSNNIYFFDKKSTTQMQSKFDSKPNYYKSKPVDGLSIEGAYTQYASLIPSTTNEPQYLIWFYKDGRFDDRGIYVVNLKNPYANPEDAPGKGKYRIENYSIFLIYDDGRLKQLGFSGFLDKDPTNVTEAYFMGRNIYYRKDKNYNSNLNKL